MKYTSTLLVLALVFSLGTGTVLWDQSDIEAEETTPERRPNLIDVDLRGQLDASQRLNQLNERRANIEADLEARAQRQDTFEANAEARAEARVETRTQQQEDRAENQAQRQDNRAQNQEEREAKRAERSAQRAERLAEFKANREEKMAERRAKIEERYTLRQENRERFSEKAQARISTVTQNLNNNYSNHLNSAEGLYARVESRITEMANNGYDTDEAENLLAQARTALDAAADASIEAQTSSEVVLDADEAKELWSEAKSSYQEAKESLSEVKESLREVVEELKSLRAEGSVELTQE